MAKTRHRLIKVCLNNLSTNVIDDAEAFYDFSSIVPRSIFYLKVPHNLHSDFMGKKKLSWRETVVSGGDFRQVLHIVVRGSQNQIEDACLKNDRVWVMSVPQMHPVYGSQG